MFIPIWMIVLAIYLALNIGCVTGVIYAHNKKGFFVANAWAGPGATAALLIAALLFGFAFAVWMLIWDQLAQNRYGRVIQKAKQYQRGGFP